MRGKRRWLILLGAVALLVLVVAAEQVVLWWGSRSPAEEAARVAALAGVGPGQVVAELGAGAGEMARAMAPRLLPGGRLFVTELDETQLARLREMVAEERWTHVDVRAGEEAGTALPPLCCALVYMRHVFHHFGDPRAMSRALHETVAAGGRLAVIDFEPQWTLGLIAPVVRDDGQRTGHGITPDDLIDHLAAAGFVVERLDSNWTSGSFLVLARKQVSEKLPVGFSAATPLANRRTPPR